MDNRLGSANETDHPVMATPGWSAYISSVSAVFEEESLKPSQAGGLRLDPQCRALLLSNQTVKKDRGMAKDKAEKPLSLYPMPMEEALKRFMQVDPKEYEEYRKQEQKKRKVSKKG